MRRGGSLEQAAALALRALIDRGATNLEAKLGALVASYGDTCFRTAAACRGDIRRPDGALYHVESVRRATRNLARKGFIYSARVFPGQRAERMKYRSAQGTTDKRFLWKNFGIKNPVARAAARRARQAQEIAEEQQNPARRRFSAPITVLPATKPARAHDDLDSVIEKAEQHLQSRWEERDAQHLRSLMRPPSERGRGPPE